MNATSSAGVGSAPLWLTAVAKTGYAARGIIYIIIGSLALLKAFGNGGESAGSKDALAKLLQAPGGIAMLWVMAAGLVSYSLWRFCQAVLDADDHGTDGKGLTVRGGLLVSSLSHLGLAAYCGYLAVSQAESEDGGGGTKQSLVAKALGWPGGRWLVVFVGLCIIGAGIAHAAKARKEKYEKHFVIDHDTMKKLEPVCKFGLYCRSVVFAIIGGMFLYAAFTQDPDDAGGLKEVLNATSQQAFGTALLAVMAAGLFAFGLYSIFEAIYRKIDKPND